MEEKILEEEPKRPKLAQELEQKFQTLEKYWQTYTHSSSKTRPKTKKKTHKFSSTNDSTSVHPHMSLLDNSPRHLMSSLQHPTRRRMKQRSRLRSSPSISSPFTITASGDVWRVRENKLANEETQRDRKMVVGSGKLKGRRLFDEDDEVGFDGDDEIQSICTEICGFNGGGKTGEVEQGMLCFGEEKEKEVVGVKEVDAMKEDFRNGNGSGRGKGYGVKYVLVMVSSVIALVAFAVGFIGGIVDGFGSDSSFCPPPT